MNNYTSSITCHQNKLTQNTNLSGDGNSEQTCIINEIACLSSSLLLNYSQSNASIPINIPQSHNSSFESSMLNNNSNDLVYKSLSSTGSDSSFDLDSILMDSYENFGSPNEDLTAYFDMLGVNSPIGSNIECLSPSTVQSAEYSNISSPQPLFHFGSPTSQENSAAAAAQFYTNMSLDSLAGSLHSNFTDDDNMQLKLELAEMLPQQNISQNDYNESSNILDSLSPYFSGNSQMVPENDNTMSPPFNEFETMGFPDINLFSQPSSPLPENELTMKGGSIPECYYSSNSPQTPQNLASEPSIDFGSLFDTVNELTFYPDIAESEWHSAHVSCPPHNDNAHIQSQDLTHFFDGYYHPISTIHTSSVTGKQSKVYKCPFCSHTSNRGNNMREHVQIHNPHRPKPFMCSLCKRPFARKHDMNRHFLSCRKQSDKKILKPVPLS